MAADRKLPGRVQLKPPAPPTREELRRLLVQKIWQREAVRKGRQK